MQNYLLALLAREEIISTINIKCYLPQRKAVSLDFLFHSNAKRPTTNNGKRENKEFREE